MRKFDSVNVIPFIDVMLVLLAIVLTTATFVSHGQLDIVLPKSSAAKEHGSSDTVEIAIDREEKFYFDGKEVAVGQIRSLLVDLPADTSITLLVDEVVQFQHFILVIEMLKELSLDNVSVLTRRNG